MAEISQKSPEPMSVKDCLGMIDIHLPEKPINCKKCVATLVTPDYIPYLDTMLTSLRLNGGVDDATWVVFILNDYEDRCIKAVKAHNAIPIICASNGRTLPNIKSILYSTHQVVDADAYMVIDADTLVYSDIGHLFNILAEHDANTILIGGETDRWRELPNITNALPYIYGSDTSLVDRWGFSEDQKNYALCINDGLIVFRKQAMQSLWHHFENAHEHFKLWASSNRIGNQFFLNAAIAAENNAVELDATYNAIVENIENIEIWREGGKIRTLVNGRYAKVVHFAGDGKRVYPYFAAPIVFPEICAALPAEPYRAPIDEVMASMRLLEKTRAFPHIEDTFLPSSSTFGVYGFLHHMLYSVDTCTVLETGSYNGLSTLAAIAAVSDKPNGQLTQILAQDKDINTVWLGCLMPRKYSGVVKRICNPDWITVLIALMRAGNTYDAALIEGDTSESKIWSQFQVVKRLVKDNGYIIIKAPTTNFDAVRNVVARLEKAGYGASVHFIPEANFFEDNSMGMAIIQNRSRIIIPIDPDYLPAITIGTYFSDEQFHAVKNFIASLSAQDYYSDKVHLIVSIGPNSPESEFTIRQYAKTCSMTVEIVTTDKSEADGWQKVLEAYLARGSEEGMVIWETTTAWDENFLRQIVESGWPLTQAVGCGEGQAKVSAYVRDFYGSTRYVIPVADLPYHDFCDYVRSGAIYAVKNLWQLFAVKGGWTDCRIPSLGGIEGCLWSALGQSVFMVKSTTGWHSLDGVTAFKADVTSGKTRMFQKSTKPKV